VSFSCFLSQFALVGWRWGAVGIRKEDWADSDVHCDLPNIGNSIEETFEILQKMFHCNGQ
jgi:hypothetical protein